MTPAGELFAKSWRWVALALAVSLSLASTVALWPEPESAPVAGPPATTPTAIPTTELLAATADNASIVVEAEAARAANAALPILADAIEPARSFAGPSDPAVRERAALCLAQAMYYEAGFEGEGGRRAVAQVVLNRVRHPAFPHSVCDVVYQRIQTVCQFTFACDGALARTPLPAVWDRTLREAHEALAGRVDRTVGMATHYHADYVYPRWAPRLDKVAAVGQHLFYRWPLGWGRRSAFTARYSEVEAGSLVVADPMPSDGAATGEASASPPSEIAPRRSDNDAGYVDTSKGWRPSISEVEPVPPSQAAKP